ncbi:MAG: Fic family protein [Butyrivibrio sp.]|nr:Fic family protein [Butyrivibrio sp.]
MTYLFIPMSGKSAESWNVFYRNIEPGYAGWYRDVPVLVTGSSYPVAAPEKVQGEVDRLFNWIQKERDGYHPMEFAAQLHSFPTKGWVRSRRCSK